MANETEGTNGTSLDPKKIAELAKSLDMLKTVYADLEKAIKDKGFLPAINDAKELAQEIANFRKSASGDIMAVSEAYDDFSSKLRIAAETAQKTLRDFYQEQAKNQQEFDKNLTDLTKKLPEGLKHLGKRENFQDFLDGFENMKESIISAQNVSSSKLQGLASDIGNYRTAIQSLEKVQDRSDKQEQQLLKTKQNLSKAEQDFQKEKRKLQETEARGILQNIEAAKSKAQETLETIKATAARREEAAAYLPLIRLQQIHTDSLKEVNKGMGGLIDALTGASGKSNLFASMYIAMSAGADKSKGSIFNLSTAISSGLKQSFLDPEKAANRFFNVLNERVVKSSFEFDKIGASIGKATGGFRQGFEEISLKFGGTTITELSKYGTTLESYGKTYEGLTKSIGAFNNMTGMQRRVLMDAATSMETLGVSASTFGGIAATYMASFGKSASGAKDVINGLAKDALALGKSVEQYTAAFEQALSKISGYGREATKIFRELEAVSAATKGVVTSADLLSISDKFKDFDSAAESVSKLNAMLGGMSVDMLSMMKADPAEQIMMIKRAAQDSGLEFEKLNIGYKRLLAEYFGGDVRKAAAFFKADIMEAQQLIDRQIVSEEELAEAKEKNVDAQKKLDALLTNIKINLSPIVEGLSTVVGWIGKLLNFPGGPLIGTLGMIGFAFAGMRLAIRFITAGVMEAATRFGTSFPTMTGNVNATTVAVGQLNTALLQTSQNAGMAAQQIATMRAAASGGGPTPALAGGGGGGGPAMMPVGGAGGGDLGAPASGGRFAGIKNFVSSNKVQIGATAAVIALGAAAYWALGKVKEKEEQQNKQRLEQQKRDTLEQDPFSESGRIPLEDTQQSGDDYVGTLSIDPTTAKPKITSLTRAKMSESDKISPLVNTGAGVSSFSLQRPGGQLGTMPATQAASSFTSNLENNIGAKAELSSRASTQIPHLSFTLDRQDTRKIALHVQNLQEYDSKVGTSIIS